MRAPDAAVVVTTFAACLAGCADGDRGGGAADAPYDGPPVAGEVLQMESFPVQWAAVARVAVPTGGHAFTLDDAAHAGDVFDLRATLERPAHDEMVTQALEELTVRHGTGTRPIRRLRVFVRLTRRGEPAEAAPWRLAASAP